MSLIVSVGLLKRFSWNMCYVDSIEVDVDVRGKSFIDPIADRDAFGWVEPWRCEAGKFCILLRKHL